MEIVGGRYRIEGLAGKGGMGSVYRARDVQSNELVALKIVDGEGDNPRFAREATLLARLSHPGIVRYVGQGTIPGRGSFLVMEWLAGLTLAQRLTNGALSLAEALTVGRTLAGALAAAHATGIVHRDVKPSNIVLRDGDTGRAVLVDFGIARSDTASHVITASGAVIGTPAYMSPEQARAEHDVDARADVFSLGCVLFECLVGRPPFVGATVVAVLAKILLEAAPRVRTLRPDIPRELDALVASMLEKVPQRRPRDGAAVAEALATLTERGDGPDTPNAESAAIGATEQRFITILLARAGVPSKDEDEDDDVLAGLTTESEIADIVSSSGMSIASLANGLFVGSFNGQDDGGDAALHVARAALVLRARLPNGAVALATGRAVVSTDVPVGDVIDRAAALLARDRVTNGVLIDDATAVLAEGRFELGMDGTGTTRVLLRERELGPSVVNEGHIPPPFVGRERELAILEATYRECIDEPVARAAIVLAPPGTGKSRLGRELIARLQRSASPPHIWLGRSSPTMERAALALAGDLFRRVIGLREDQPLATRREKILARVGRAQRIAVFLGEVVGTPFDDHDDPTLRAARRKPDLLASQIDDAIAAFVEGELKAAQQPLVFVLEDVHWADAASIRLLSSLLVRMKDQPVMFLALARPSVDTVHPKLWDELRCQRIILEPLLRKAAERLARAVLGEDSTDVDEIVRRAEGNALFVEELARACADGRSLSDLPPTVAAAVEARLTSLDPDARRLLRASAVFGERFWRGGVATLLDVPADVVDARALQLERLGIVSAAKESRFDGEREYVFRHALVRDAAYGMLTDEDRRVGHALAGTWLEKRLADAVLLAHHFDLGARPNSAARWYVVAAEAALAANDFVGLSAHVARAEACGAAGNLLGRIRLAEAEGAAWRSDWSTSADRARAAIDLLDRGSERWFQSVGVASSALGRLEKSEAVRDVVLLLDACPSSDARTGRARAIARARAATPLAYAGERELVERMLEGCEQEPGADGDPAVLAWLCNADLDRRANLGEGVLPEIPRRAIDLYNQVGDRRSAIVQEGMYVLTLHAIGARDIASAELERCISDATQANLPTYPLLYAQQAIRSLNAARLGDLEPIRESVEWARTNLSARGATGQRILYGLVVAELERWDLMQDVEALTAESTQTPPFHSVALSLLARLCASRNEGARAVVLAEEGRREAESRGMIHWGANSIDVAPTVALAAAGRTEEAAQSARLGVERLHARAATYGSSANIFLEHAYDSRTLLELARKYGH